MQCMLHVMPTACSPSLPTDLLDPPPPPRLLLPLAAAVSVSTDWSHSGDEQAAAYNRAGLPHWAAQCTSEPNSPTEAAGQPEEPASQLADHASQAALAPVLADQPSAVVQATISDVLLTLPHDQDFGRAERFVELWSKAFGQVESQKCLTACSCPDVDNTHCCTLLDHQLSILLRRQYFMLHHPYFTTAAPSACALLHSFFENSYVL